MVSVLLQKLCSGKLGIIENIYDENGLEDELNETTVRRFENYRLDVEDIPKKNKEVKEKIKEMILNLTKKIGIKVR